jgi:imidazolonepropionase-like amidohydrolase
MPFREAIKAATINAAKLLDLSDEVGTIASGKSADVIAVDSSPSKRVCAPARGLRNGARRRLSKRRRKIRCRFVDDSPLEGAGFEPSVPR